MLTQHGVRVRGMGYTAVGCKGSYCVCVTWGRGGGWGHMGQGALLWGGVRSPGLHM